jgi:hypothetical protein
MARSKGNTSGIKVKMDGKTFKTDINELEVDNTYIVHLDGFRVYITVTKEQPDFCRQLQILKRVSRYE